MTPDPFRRSPYARPEVPPRVVGRVGTVCGVPDCKACSVTPPDLPELPAVPRDANAALLAAAEGLILHLGAFPPDRAAAGALDRLKRAVLAVSPGSEAVFYNPPTDAAVIRTTADVEAHR